MNNEKKLEYKTCEKQIEKKRERARCGTLPQGPGNTIRSKIEDKLTEDKLKDRESAAHANTLWAPSDPERIEVAYGKVPLRASGAAVFLEYICFSPVVLRKI